MEMYNEGLADNTAMIGGTNVPVEPPSLDQHPQVKKVRKLSLVFIGINLVSTTTKYIFNKKYHHCMYRFFG
jgi:hypothetical protein